MKRAFSTLFIFLILSVFTINSVQFAAEYFDSAVTCADDPMHGIVMLKGEKIYPSVYPFEDWTYGQVRNHYLVQNEDETLTVIAAIHDYNRDLYQWDFRNVLVEMFSADGRELLGTKTIPRELSQFGGFYAGEKYNYFVFGQKNEKKSDKTEVIRVVKYSKAWKRLGAASLYGANTMYPFDAGTLSIAEGGGKLSIHTCHERYDSHQSNMTLVFDEEKNTVRELNDPHSIGFCSHSWEQHVRVYGDYVYFMDIGDGNPRAIKITRSLVSELNPTKNVRCTNAVDLTKTDENEGNWTGAAAEGFEVTKDTVITVGDIVNYDNYDKKPDDTRNIFVAVTDKDLKKTKVNMLTSYNKNSGITVIGAQLTKINDKKLLVMWRETIDGDQRYITKYATIDANGNLTSPIYSNGFPITDCKPILCKDGKIRWFAGMFYNCFNKEAQIHYHDTKMQPCLYTMDPSDLASSDGIISFYGNGERGGITGDCFWTLNGSELTVTGNGKMDDYSCYDEQPWLYDYSQPFITKVTIDNGVKNIGVNTFRFNETLSYVSIPSSVRSIGNNAFYGCTSLEQITIPSGVTSIGEDAFSWSGLTSITIPSSVKNIGNCAFKNTMLSSVTIKSGVERIGDEAFSDCDNLTSVTISEGVTSIGKWAFCSTNLRSVMIPFSVMEIGQSAFWGIKSISGYEDTAAEAYARDNDIDFISLGKVPAKAKLGDANGDGDITLLDVTFIQRYKAFLDTGIADCMLMNADVDGSGELEIIDATWIQRWMAFMDVPFAIGDPI